MKTDKEKADAYRTAAEFLESVGYYVAEVLWREANELDPPRPEPGPIVFENGTHGFVLRGHGSVDTKWDIVTDFGELLTFADAMPFKPARMLADDEVAVNADEIRYAINDLRHDDALSVDRFLWSILPDRDEEEAMEAPQ